jgi:glycosyltransferase involved in cell wall biosynthesis
MDAPYGHPGTSSMNVNSSNTPWLSILIPVYNVQDYLKECLHSVLAQVDEGVEIITLNDVSTDQSLDVLNEIQRASAHPITIMQHTKNQGLSASRNSMLDVAQGEYIWFLDSDDMICDHAIAKLKHTINTHKPDLVLCDFYMLRSEIKLKHKQRGEMHRKSFGGPAHQLCSDGDALFHYLYKTAQLHIWSKIAKRTLWGADLRFPVGQLMEDQTVTPRLFLRAQTYYYYNEVWVAYRQRPGSILSTPSIQRLKDSSISAENVLQEWLDKYPNLSEKSKFTFAYSRAKMLIGNSRELRKQNKTEELAWHQQQFFKTTQSTKGWIIKNYIKRGWFYRLARLINHLN